MAGQYRPISWAVHQDRPSCLSRLPAHCPITNLEVCIETPGNKISQPSAAQIVSPTPSLTLQGEVSQLPAGPLGPCGWGNQAPNPPPPSRKWLTDASSSPSQQPLPNLFSIWQLNKRPT